MTEPDADEILTLDEVAAYLKAGKLKAGKKTACRLAQQGQIPAFKQGGTWRFRRPEPHRWMAAQTGGQAAAPLAATAADKTQDKK
ncbi:helix-turn-helix domain-containing protein [Curvibacter gracilis]|uniref:helix-turn-helix domain-containing protein n=1 Tax=Curvibacter gracilis TaxID=230310 RepID=UPI0004BAB840|nr:helix-turn-helix domain-containing protein [Curvibacter gracilis]